MTNHEIVPETLRIAGLSKSQGHKYAHGHALVVSGGQGRSGAARLAARGALRIGAGLVTIAVPGPALAEVAAQVTAIMVRHLSPSHDLRAILRDDRINAVCIGPGLGIASDTAELVLQALRSDRPVVVDADAVSLIAQNRDLFSALHKQCILTPHGGEFARLFPDISERLSAQREVSKADAAIEAAKRAGCVVLLKGAETVVARPDGTAGIHRAEGARAAPWLATAGSGDVLAGFITGLLARGYAPGGAADLAVYLHAEAARAFGPGLIAEDLPEKLPGVLAGLVG